MALAITKQIEHEAERFCRDYCKYKDAIEKESDEVSADYMVQHLCKDCPVDKLR